MPDIDERIAAWRMEMARQLGDDAEILNELESHLRDEIANLVQRGEAPEHAVELAMTRIGAPRELAHEFAKSATWLPIYVVAGGGMLLFALLLWALFGSGGVAIPEVREPRWLYPHIFSILIGYSLSFAIGALAIFYAVQRSWRDLSFGKANAWNRAQYRIAFLAVALTVVGVILGSIWSALARDTYWSWDGREIGGLLVIAWQAILLLSVWRSPESRRWLMILGFAGNVVVAYAWHGFISWHMVLIAGAQVPFLVVGLLPSGWLRRTLRLA